MAQLAVQDPTYMMDRSAAASRRLMLQRSRPARGWQVAPLTTLLIVAALGFFVLVAYAGHVTKSTDTASVVIPEQAPVAALDPREEVAVGDRYLVPLLPASVVAQLPEVEAMGDQYLVARIELAELVIGDHIPAAEDLASAHARDLPGFRGVLLADGFRQDADGAWYYDRFASWMRFPLNRS